MNEQQIPAMIYSDEGVVLVIERRELEELFANASEWYRSEGIASTSPEIERIGILTDRLASVAVRWPFFDKDGKERGSERSHYIVESDEAGRMGIRLALTRTR